MSGARTLGRGLSVLIAVRDAGRPLSVTDLARITDLDRAVIARLLPPLIEEGFLRRDEDPRRYVIGPAMQRSEGGRPAPDPIDEVATTEAHLSWEDLWPHFGDTIETPGTGGHHFADPLVDDAYLALVSFAGELPLSVVVGLVAEEARTGPLGAMLGRIRLADLGPEPSRILEGLQRIDPVAAFMEFFDGLPERDQGIILSRLTAEPETLEAIAERCSLTRERVRQILKRRRDEFESILASNARIVQRTGIARTRIGRLVDLDHLTSTLRLALPISDHLTSELEEPLLFLLFPERTYSRYHEKAPWFVTAGAREVLDGLRGRALSEGVSLEEFSAVVSDLGRVPEMERFVRSIGLTVIDEQVFARNTSLNSRAVLLLQKEDVPLSFDDIVEGLRVEGSSRSLRNALFADERIVRVDKDTFALAAWGLPSYSTVRDLIRQELESLGGEAHISTIIEGLTAKFDIQPSSIVTYSHAPDFVRVVPGVIRLRAADEPFEDVVRPLEALRGCVRIGRRWALRVELSASVLKGFSMTLPSGMAGHFGVAPGESEQLPTDRNGRISVVRKGLQDNIGRLRWVAEELGLSVGGMLFILLPERQGGRISFIGVSREDLDGARPARRAGLLLGLQEDLTLAGACGALGLPRGSRPGEVVDRLRSRGEDELAGLVGEVLGSDAGADAVVPVDTKDIGRMLGL